LRVEAPGGPQSVRFLHVLQGADAGASADPVTRIDAGVATAVVVRNVAIVFPNDVSAPLSGLAYTVPSTTASHRITGLTPNGDYTASTRPVGANVEVTVTSGGSLRADAGGVLTFGGSSPPARRRSVRR